ncbi:MAG: TonB-dependent receptor [Ignavibacteriaceae bacterium]|nr:TonB-dependent receptor [Ignavibacteriaceae bacterium]
MRRIATVLSILVLTVFSISSTVLAAGASVTGLVKDSKTGEPLFGANVILVGTSMGGATDMDGKYEIPAVIPGTYTIRVTYIGYVEQKTKITVEAGARLKKNFQLEAVGIEGQTVVVTAQASGQKAAINQQLTSDQIVNVVSAAKIQELPDANAAESVGRLPGVSVTRSGGEGTEVVIRGLSPKYNEVMIDGIKMSSTSTGDRSTDLSMISSNMLDGIEVSKTVTPDMDADVLGGTVNFEMKEAKVKVSGVPVFSLLVQGGYNNLSDVYNKWNNYKYVGSVEDRFFDDRFGVFAQIDVERKNLSSNEMGASYDQLYNDRVHYETTNINLYDISRDRQRYNGALVLDYKLPDGKIKLTNFFSTGTTTAVDRGESYDVTENTRHFTISNPSGKVGIITNGLDYQQKVSIFDVNAKVSHSYSETNNPNNWNASFLQSPLNISQFSGIAQLNPKNVAAAATNDLSKTYLSVFTNEKEFSKERAYSGSLDLKTNVTVNDDISAEIKFGGKLRYQERRYDYDYYYGTLTQGGAGEIPVDDAKQFFSIPATANGLPLSYFLDNSYNYGKFLGGDYTMIAPLDYGKLGQLANLFSQRAAYYASHGMQGGYGNQIAPATSNSYHGHENLSASYIMANIKIGSQLTIIPGVRYQDNRTTYTGARGYQTADPLVYSHYDTTAVQDHGYWLPDVTVRYKPLSWCDVRLSYTNTVSYPSYSQIIPRIDLSGNSIAYVNYRLLPSRSTNYDAYVSFYDNTIGLFTVGGFLKQIDNFIYSYSRYVKGAEAAQYLPYGVFKTTNPNTYSIYTFINDPYKINDYGMEAEWQTHFWYLPGPLSGLVFSTNFTHIFSKAEYPLTKTVVTGRTVTYAQTPYIARLLDQPDDVINLALGWDYKSFSVRVSLLYQSDIFTGANYWPQLRSSTSAYRRWDIAAKQELPWFGVQVYGDINNLNGANDISVLEVGGVPSSEQDYGMTADFGVRVSL